MHSVVSVFAGPDAGSGNPLAVFLDGASVPRGQRQGVAAELGFSETVFVDDAESGALQIFTPSVELGFAGHPLVGTAWLLAHEGTPLDTLRPPAGEVAARTEGDRAFVTGRPEWAPPFEWTELDSPAAVEALDGPPRGHDLIGAYAWLDERSVRARVFPLRLGIVEDEATGAAAVRLGALLARPLSIHQGRGSRIEVRPLADGRVEVGGRVTRAA